MWYSIDHIALPEYYYPRLLLAILLERLQVPIMPWNIICKDCLPLPSYKQQYMFKHVTRDYNPFMFPIEFCVAS